MIGMAYCTERWRGPGCFRALGIVSASVLVALAAPELPAGDAWPQFDANPSVIRLDLPAPEDSAGGIIVSDLDGNEQPDFLVTVPGHVGAYRTDGRKLWVLQVPVQVGGQSESQGLPGHHGPGVQVGDIDADGRAEVVFLTRDGKLRAVDGASGEEEVVVSLEHPSEAERWEHAVLASLRKKGSRDILLQATNRKGYRTGRFLAAYPLERIVERARRGATVSSADALWTTGEFLACAHNGARVADLDGDGRDEVLGGTLLSPAGKLLHRIPLRGHIDSIFVHDVRPDLPGLEVVALEEGGGNRVFLFGTRGDIWISHHRNQEPQNAAVGEFDPSAPGLEVWCRSRYNTHQKPFAFDARGKLIASYELDKVAPEGWTDAGVEVIYSIQWTGGEKALLAAKERHEDGDVAVLDALSGKFHERFVDKAARLYVADVSGDWREELVVLNGSELHVYHNPEACERPDRPRLWSMPEYRRSKMTHNYYSP